ncbi:MAG TPA: P-II family nitrogen regulator [Burkholderiales bacterium]|nr:P-II family nitrogen regulator [Burkholderiales bacterium]
MKYVKAFVHHNRVGDLVHALEVEGFRQLSLFAVRGLLRAITPREQDYSVELGGSVISEVQMELFCEDDRVTRAVEIFRTVGRTGKSGSGWVYVIPIEVAQAID